MKHILVVDDDLALRDAIARVLRDEGYAVSTAANGAEALAQVHDALPDGVLLDLVMPEVDGETFLRVCRDDPTLANLAIAICSTSQRAREIGTVLGVQVYIPKPFDLGDLIGGVAQLLATGVGAAQRDGPSQLLVAMARQLSAETRSRTAVLWHELVRAEDCLLRSYQMAAATSECLAKVVDRCGFTPGIDPLLTGRAGRLTHRSV